MEYNFAERKLLVCDLSLIKYQTAWEIQKKYFEARSHEKIKDIIFICEHPHTYTLGKVADKKNLLLDDKMLKEKNIDVFEIDRGGDITYHGPGQIVGYPIINLANWKKDTHLYLRALEEVLMLTCIDYGLIPSRIEKYTGVWIEDRKICAIGIKVSRWITMHGFAFNVNTDLSNFYGIIPCGISDKEVTSLSREIVKQFDINEVKQNILKNFEQVFSYTQIENISIEELENSVKN